MLVETRWSSSECNVVCGKNCLPSGGLRSASDGKGPQKKKNPNPEARKTLRPRAEESVPVHESIKLGKADRDKFRAGIGL